MSGSASSWLAGAALRPFPIAEGTPLTGYMAREGPAEGTRDPLTIGALVLEWGKERLAIVAADVAAVDGDLVREIAEAAGINRAQLALCASHTHSGPAGVVARLHPASADELDLALRARFVETATEAIAAARRDLQPVDLLCGVTEVHGVAANRNDSALATDERLSVLATRRSDGSLHCALVHFACHPTILGAASRLVSADFPGALRRRLADLLRRGDRAPAVLYVNGAAGDLSTRFTRRAQDAAEVERLGGVLAEAALAALRDAGPLGGPLRQGSASVALTPRRVAPHPPIPFPYHTQRAPGIRPGAGGSSAQRRIAETRAQGEVMLAALAALPEGAIATNCTLDGWRLGEVVLVSVPAELFASFGTQITDASAEPTIVLGYTNGYVGYLADSDAFAAGTYEALASPYGPGDGERVAAAATALAAQLRLARDAQRAAK